ncbi:MAG: hypothetical protein J6P19_01640, partial [Acetobacter sp.]|nr:hypothetical protein [Acetobacter sp.]
MIFGLIATGIAALVKLAGPVISGIAATAKTCFSVGAKAVSGALSKIGTTVQSVSTSLENFAKGPLTEFGKKVSEQAVSIYNRSLEIAESKDLGPIFGPLVADLKSNFVNKTAHKVAEKLGIIEKGEKQEHVGCRVEEADKHANDWQQRETFNSFKNYYKYLKEKIPEVDEQKIEKNERYYQLLGMMVEQEAIQEELGIK